MKKDIFAEGVVPGGLIHSLDIKILICYLLDYFDKSFSKEEIIEILQREGLANYFAISQGIEELIETGGIALDYEENEISYYKVTSLGKEANRELLRTLPHTVKEKGLRSADRFMLEQKTKTENLAKIKKVKDGYVVECRVLDVGSDLMKLELFTGTREQGDRVKEKFLSNPLEVYKRVLDILIEENEDEE